MRCPVPIVGKIRDRVVVRALHTSLRTHVEYAIDMRDDTERRFNYVLHSVMLYPTVHGVEPRYYEGYREAVQVLREYNFDYCDNNFDSLRELARAPARR